MNSYDRIEYEHDTNERAKKIIDCLYFGAMACAWGTLIWIFAVIIK